MKRKADGKKTEQQKKISHRIGFKIDVPSKKLAHQASSHAPLLLLSELLHLSHYYSTSDSFLVPNIVNRVSL